MKARNAKLSKRAAADALAAATTRPAEATLASARAVAPPKLEPGDMLVYKTRKSVRGPCARHHAGYLRRTKLASVLAHALALPSSFPHGYSASCTLPQQPRSCPASMAA